MWIASFRHNTALQLVFLTLWITFFLLAAGDWFGNHSLHVFGGYTGMVCLYCGVSLGGRSHQRRLRTNRAADRSARFMRRTAAA